jgi:hypothetical protein
MALDMACGFYLFSGFAEYLSKVIIVKLSNYNISYIFRIIRNISATILALINGDSLPTITEIFCQKMAIGTHMSTASTAASKLVLHGTQQRATLMSPVLLAKLVLGMSRIVSRVIHSPKFMNTFFFFFNFFVNRFKYLRCLAYFSLRFHFY